MRALASLLLAAVVLVTTAACSSTAQRAFTPATMADVDQLRADQLEAARKQRDKFQDTWNKGPKTVKGLADAVGAGFDTHVEILEEAKDKSDKESGGLPWWQLLLGGGTAGGIVLGLITWLLRRYDKQDHEGKNGEKLPEGNMVTGLLEIAKKVGIDIPGVRT